MSIDKGKQMSNPRDSSSSGRYRKKSQGARETKMEKNEQQCENNMKYVRAYAPLRADVPICADGNHIERIVETADAAARTGVGFVLCSR